MGQHNSLWGRWELGHPVSPLVVSQTPLATGCAADVIASAEAHTILKQSPVHTASKHALLGLTKATASDYAQHGIRINTVSPGVIRTLLTMAEGQRKVTDRLATRIPLGASASRKRSPTRWSSSS